MSKLKIISDDLVVVVSGSDKSKSGKVLKSFPKDQSLLVAGVNVVSRHIKATQNSEGKIIKKEQPVHVSNVALIDKKENKASKVGIRFLEGGKKVRFTKLSGESV